MNLSSTVAICTGVLAWGETCTAELYILFLRISCSSCGLDLYQLWQGAAEISI